MTEPFDLYSDSVMVSTTPWGANLSFQLREAHPSPPPNIAQPMQLGTIRMSTEHLKVMAFIIRRQILEHEREGGVSYDVPTAVLSQLQIAREDWDIFWKGS